MEEKIFEKTPMPLSEFLTKLKELAKRGQWKIYKEAIKKRKTYFQEHPDKGTY